MSDDNIDLKKNVLQFPPGFLWGTATSAYQVEGGNVNADWWEWEHQKIVERRMRNAERKREGGLRSIHNFEKGEEELFLSGKGADHYARFQEDFDFAKGMHNSAHRLSLEWSRIEPHEGIFDQKEIEHYRKVLLALRERGMKSMVTLHHFTNPSWFAKKGGWLKRRNVKFFLQYVDRAVKEFCDLVDFWVTINEPHVYVQMSYLGGWGTQVWQPEKRSLLKAVRVLFHLARAHRASYSIIHSYDRISRRAMVGYVQNFASYTTSHKHNMYDQLIVFFADNVANHSFYFLTKGCHDFAGLNYYFRTRFTRKRWSFVPQLVDISEQGRERSDMGWEIYPHGLYSCLMDVKEYGIPIYVTENGIAATDDSKRSRFLISHIQEMYYALKGGADVKGYFHWSLLDNFEWDLGYTQKFGLVGWDTRTGERIAKPSARVYGRICEANGIPHDLLAYSLK